MPEYRNYFEDDDENYRDISDDDEDEDYGDEEDEEDDE